MSTTSDNTRHGAPDAGTTKITGGFWAEKQRINREHTIPIEHGHLESTRRLETLKGTWKPESGYVPHIFWDSDVAKWLEAAAYSLATHPDPELEAKCDAIINDLAALQGDDGYLNSYFLQVEPEARWQNVRDRHELYCAGHLMEAAVAHHRTTGKRTFLDVMCKYADYIGSVFGPESDKMHGYPGHEEIELALVKLYEETGTPDYLELSKYFVDQRGQQPHYFDEEIEKRGEDPGSYRWGKHDYLQAHLPVRDQKTAEGHSVRACYLYAGMADVARESGDASLAEACRTLWRNITEKRMYIHGGVGSSHHGERFTYDYDLPNEEAYAETCAAIALVFFAQRMFLLEQDARYIDVLERALYNGVISGVSADGSRFFYDNYLASDPGYHQYRGRKSPDRQEWFGCACCPPNLAQLIASVNGYLYAVEKSSLWLNLYATYESEAAVGGSAVRFSMETDYPWDGRIRVVIDSDEDREFDVKLRIPAWCRTWSLSINGQTDESSASSATDSGYVTIRRSWRAGDEIDLVLEMSVERVRSHPSVRHNVGKVALQRGPILFCLEEIDNGPDLSNLFLPEDAEFVDSFEPELLGGVVVISGTGLKRSTEGWGNSLYRAAGSERYASRSFRAIPYFAWDNRGVGAMAVWINSVGVG